jgi:hypothetical protein
MKRTQALKLALIISSGLASPRGQLKDNSCGFVFAACIIGFYGTKM